MMTPNQKKTFYEIITSNDLNWNEFSEKVDVRSEVEYPRMVHTSTSLYFEFNFDANYQHLDVGGGWTATLAPGENNTPKEFRMRMNSWDQIKDLITIWVGRLKKEIESYNFLNELESFRERFGNLKTSNFLTEEKFSDSDKQFIKDQLSIFKKEVRLQNGTVQEEKINFIDAKINYLIDRLEKNYSKIDWVNIFIGTIFSLIVTEGIEILKEPSVLKHLKFLFQTLVGGIIK